MIMPPLGTGKRLSDLVSYVIMYSHVHGHEIGCFLFQGDSLLSQLRTAIIMAAKHQVLFNRLSSALSQTQVAKWEAEVLAWDAGESRARDPYQDTETGASLNKKIASTTDLSNSFNVHTSSSRAR
jgi:hypothetical protein